MRPSRVPSTLKPAGLPSMGAAALCAGLTILVALSALIQEATAAEADHPPLPLFEVPSARSYLSNLSQTLATEGSNVEFLYARARIYSYLGDVSLAETLGREALTLQTNRADISLFLADLLVRQDRMDEAAVVLHSAATANPRYRGVQRQLGMVLDRLGKPAEAEAAFVAAIKSYPADPAAPLLLGRFLLDHGRISEAVTNLELACRLDTNSANPYYPLFQAQTKLGNKEAANQALKRFKELKTDENAEQGVGMMTDDRFDNEADLRAYVSGLHMEIAAIYRQRERADLAEAHLLQAIAIDSKQHKPYERLSDLYMQQGKVESALQLLQKLTEVHPDAVWAHVNYGTILLQMKRYPAAVQELTRALELDPNQPQALHNLARHYLNARSNLPQALALAQRLVAAEPTGFSYDLLGFALYSNGRTNDAIQALATAVEKSPENPAFRQRYERVRKLAPAPPPTTAP